MLICFAERSKRWHGVLYGYSERGDLFGMAVTVLSLSALLSGGQIWYDII